MDGGLLKENRMEGLSYNLVCEALSHAGEDQQLMERLEHLDVRRITPDKVLPPMEFLFRLFGKPCFPRGELVGLTGKPKSGKTFISSILMTLCFRDDVLSIHRMDQNRLKVLWYDTEQSDESTQDILKNRIIPMINGNAYSTEPSDFSPEGFDIFNVRQDVWTERMPLLEAAIGHYKPDLVIVDGIRDLINDINDGVLAQDTVERLMHLASDNHCCIVCVLHQNKAAEDRNLRGWIGTELTHKAFEVYECEKDEYRTFSLTQKMTRKYDIINSLKYIVDAQGIPQLADGGQTSAHGQQPADTPLRSGFNRKYIAGWDENNRPVLNLSMVFEDAMPDECRPYPAKALEKRVEEMVNIGSYHYYNRINKMAIDQGIITRTHDANGHVCYVRRPAAQELPLINQPLGDAPY